MKPIKIGTYQRGFLGGLFKAASSIISPVSKVLGGIGSIASPFMPLATGLLSQKGASDRNLAQIASAREQMEFQERMVQQQMDFQRRMSNTAHFREVRDLRNAGLNPILSAKYGGASTPPGAAAAGAMPHIEDEITPAVHSAMEHRRVNLEAQRTSAEVDRLQAEAEKARAEALKTKEETLTETDYKRPHIMAETDQLRQLIEVHQSTIRSHDSQIAKRDIETFILHNITTPQGYVDLQKAENMLELLDMEMKIYRSDRGQWYKEAELIGRGSTAAGLLAAGAAGVAVGASGASALLRRIITLGKSQPGKVITRQQIQRLLNQLGGSK